MEQILQTLGKQCRKCSSFKSLAEFRPKSRGLHGCSSWCRECERLYNLDWHAKNKDKRNSKRRAIWSGATRTEEEKVAARAKARVWYSSNKQRAISNFYLWVRENRDKYNAIQQKRRAVKSGIEATLTSDEWVATLDLFNRSCAYCLSYSEDLTMDHMVPLSRGGKHTADNVVPACRSCNSRKGTRSILTMVGARG